MRIDLVFPAFPPSLDGIGDYTARLAASLVPQHDVRVLTAQRDVSALEGVRVVPAFTTSPRACVKELLPLVDADPPDWFVLQYNPFSYGVWGLNLSLSGVLSSIRRRHPHTHISMMVHEPFVPLESFRFAVMATWQRWQLYKLGQACDIVFFSIENWAEQFRSWFPNCHVHHLPVSSNIPNVGASRASVRSQLGYAETDFVVGVFGGGHFSRLLPFVRRAVTVLRERSVPARVLYIGAASEKVRRVLQDHYVHDAGRLPAEDVSRHFAAMDLYLAPFRKGVSSRRGSFLVALQHGVASVSTRGIHTGPELAAHDGSAFLLAPDDSPEAFAQQTTVLAFDADTRRAVGTAGRALFESVFDWPILSHRLMDHLYTAAADSTPASAPPSALSFPD